MKAITVGFILLVLGMAAVDGGNEVVSILTMMIGMCLMFKGGRDEKFF